MDFLPTPAAAITSRRARSGHEAGTRAALEIVPAGRGMSGRSPASRGVFLLPTAAERRQRMAHGWVSEGRTASRPTPPDHGRGTVPRAGPGPRWYRHRRLPRPPPVPPDGRAAPTGTTAWTERGREPVEGSPVEADPPRGDRETTSARSTTSAWPLAVTPRRGDEGWCGPRPTGVDRRSASTTSMDPAEGESSPGAEARTPVRAFGRHPASSAAGRPPGRSSDRGLSGHPSALPPPARRAPPRDARRAPAGAAGPGP